MQFGTIASGSSGNCLYAGNQDSHILIDAGVSGKRIKEGLEGFGVNPAELDAILITHDHMTIFPGLGLWPESIRCRFMPQKKRWYR